MVDGFCLHGKVAEMIGFSYVRYLPARVLHVGVLSFLFGAALTSPRGFAAQPAVQLCVSNTSVSQEQLGQLLSAFSIGDAPLRRSVLARLAEDKNGCRQALESRLLEIQKKPADFLRNTGRNAALTLGLLLDMPTALSILEADLGQGDSAEWLESLRQWDRTAYTALLRKWLVRDANVRRDNMGIAGQDAQFYGLRRIEDIAFDEQTSKRASLLLGLYLRDAASNNITADEFVALNAHYATLRPGVRRIFKGPIAQLVKKSPAVWVRSFRIERSWTQFQLLELMQETGGAEVVRELIWLSENHIDQRMKSRAQSVFNAVTSAH
jgi:hypothetical protein